MKRTKPSRPNSRRSTGASRSSSKLPVSTGQSAIAGDDDALFKLSSEQRVNYDLLRRAGENDESVVPELRKFLARSPRMVKAMANNALTAWTERLSQNLLRREVASAEAANLKTDLAGESPTVLESLLADRIVLCWSQLSFFEIQEAAQIDRSLAQASFAMKRLESLQRRYLRAVRTLAEVRRLTRPAMQVNVAQNQVNVVECEPLREGGGTTTSIPDHRPR